MTVKINMCRQVQPDTPYEAEYIDGELALIAQNEQGYGNLMKLSSYAFLNHRDEQTAFLTTDEIAHHCEGVICLTGGGGWSAESGYFTGGKTASGCMA